MHDIYVYILECSNGNYYTGHTTDMERRYLEHLQGTAKCKYTRSFPPKRLAAYWKFKGNTGSALKIENAIKRLSKQEKKKLIASPNTLKNIMEVLGLE